MIMKYTTFKKHFFDFIKRNYHRRYLSAADILFYNIEEVARYDNKSVIDLTEEDALNGAKNWINYSESGFGLENLEQMQFSYYLDAFDINQYMKIQGDLFQTVWKEWELFKHYRNID